MNEDRSEDSRVEDIKGLAENVKAAYELVSPFIEEHTAIVCPDCENVCCMDKHARHDTDDLFFLNVIGAGLPPDVPGLEETDSCRNMTDIGCSLERWMRPGRCTTFFCDALLKSLQKGDPKLYRAFIEYLKYLADVRQELLTY